MNNPNNRKKDKEAQMRTIYLTLSLSLILIAVLIAMSAAFNRSADDPKDAEAIATTDEGKQVIAELTDEDVTTKESETETTTTTTTTEPSTAEPSVAEPVLPEFVSPAAGYVMKSHSGDTPVFSATMNDYRPHLGVDISGSVGDDVYACATGTIKEIWEDPMSGNCISISHDGGAVSIYRNLSPSVPENITVGATVSAGEVIGSIGDTSLLEIADEPHVHFELTINGEQVDPAAYITFNTADTEYEG